jgi:hypothetical protein
MSAFLLYPLLEGVGTASAAFATELGLGATASSTVGTGVQTAIAEKIGQFVDQQATNLIGQQNVDKFKNTVNDTKTYANDYNAFLSGNNQNTLDYFRNKPKPGLDPKPSFFPQIVPQIPSDPSITNMFDPIVSISNSMNDSFNIFGGVAISDSKLPINSGTQPNQGIIKQGIQNIEQTPTQTPTQKTDKTSDNFISTNTQVPINNTNVTTIASYLIEYANTVATNTNPGTSESITADVVSRNPGLVMVSKELSDFFSSKIPSTDEYKAI